MQIVLDSNKAPAQALMAMQPSELMTSTALQPGTQEHAEPEEVIAVTSLPLSLGQTSAKQEQQCVAQSQASETASSESCTDKKAVAVQQELIYCKEEEVPIPTPRRPNICTAGLK